MSGPRNSPPVPQSARPALADDIPKAPGHALGIDAWYLTAVDFRTGERRWRTLTGTGPAYDNNWAPITIGPDGTAYAGVFNGIVAVRDTP